MSRERSDKDSRHAKSHQEPRVHFEIAAAGLTAIALIIAADAVGFVSSLVTSLAVVVALCYVIPVLILVGLGRIPAGQTPAAASFAFLAPTIVFTLTVAGFGIAFDETHGEAGPGPGYAGLTDFFATSAQIVVGVLIVIAIEGRPSEPYGARILHRNGLIQVALGGGSALLALAMPDCLRVQAFAMIVVAGSLAAGFVAMLLLGTLRTREGRDRPT